MSTKEVFISGKCKWAHLHKPDPKFPDAWSIQLYPDTAGLETVNQLKAGKPAILNELKKDEDGYFIKLRRPVSKKIRGVDTPFAAPIITRADNTILSDVWIGNGSDVTVGCEVYTYRKGEGLAIRLKTVRADNLIPFTPVSMTEEQKKQFGGMGEQPAPTF